MDVRKKVLVLDADERLLIELERLLEDAGFDTITTWELRDALALLCTRRFDMVLVGDHPPEIPASEVLKQLRKMQCFIHCGVLHSAEPSANEYFHSLGAFAIYDKLLPNEIVQLIKNQFSDRARTVAA